MYKEKKKTLLSRNTLLLKEAMTGIAAMWAVICLSACTSKDEIVLELDKQTEENVTLEASNEVLEDPDMTLESQDTAVVSQDSAVSTQNVSDAETAVSAQSRIYVHICGAVEHPGVYEVGADSRVYEGIEAAGGFTEDAFEDYVNQAELMQDGQKIVIPTLEEAKEQGLENQSSLAAEKTSSSDAVQGRVNINTATESELCSISGIGAGRAAAIVKYRQTNGNFAAIEDIMKVSGIKEGTYEKIKDMITVK